MINGKYIDDSGLRSLAVRLMRYRNSELDQNDIWCRR